MNSRNLLLILGIMIFAAAPSAFAGQTTITGSASCIMPDFFEMNTEPAAAKTPQAQAKPPVPAGASGRYEVQSQERLIQTEENKTQISEDGTPTKVLVYSVCAK